MQSTGRIFLKLLWYKGQKNWAICNKFLRTHLCRSQFLENRPHCRSEEPLKSVASKRCQLVYRRANDRSFYRDGWWKFHYSRLKNPVLPRPPAEKCIHCLLIRDASQFYALQPRCRWFPGCIKSLDSGGCKSIHNRDIPHQLFTHFPRNHGNTVWAFAINSVQSMRFEHWRQVERSQRLLYERIESSMTWEATSTLGAKKTV